MPQISIPLSEQQSDELRKLAERLGIKLEDLALAAVSDLLNRPADEFEELAKALLEKNRELYRRLS